MAKKKVAALVIAAKRKIRRAGTSFDDTQQTTILVSDLSKQQIEMLKAEPALVVVETTVDVGDDVADAAAPAA